MCAFILEGAAVWKHVTTTVMMTMKMMNYITHNPTAWSEREESIHGFTQLIPAPRSRDPHGDGVRENNVVPLGQVHEPMTS